MVLAAFKKQETCSFCDEFISLRRMQSWQTSQHRAVISVIFSPNVLLSIESLCFLKCKSVRGTCPFDFGTHTTPSNSTFFFSVSHFALHTTVILRTSDLVKSPNLPANWLQNVVAEKNVRARLAICIICDTSLHRVGCRTFQISKCRWKRKRKEKEKTVSGLNFFFHLLSVALKAAKQREKRWRAKGGREKYPTSSIKNCSTCQQLENQKENQNVLEKIVSYSSYPVQLLSQDTVIFRVRASTQAVFLKPGPGGTLPCMSKMFPCSNTLDPIEQLVVELCRSPITTHSFESGVLEEGNI